MDAFGQAANDDGTTGILTTAAAHFFAPGAPPATVFATHSGSLSDDEEDEAGVRTSNAVDREAVSELMPSVLLEPKSSQGLLNTPTTSLTGLFPWRTMAQPRGENGLLAPGAGSAAAAAMSARENAQHSSSSTGMDAFLQMLTSQLSSGLSLKPHASRTTLGDNQAGGPSTGAATAQQLAPAQATAGGPSAPPLEPQQQSPDPQSLARQDSMLVLPEMSALLGALVPSTGSATLSALSPLASVKDRGPPDLSGHKALAGGIQKQQQEPHQGQRISAPLPSSVSGTASSVARPIIHGSSSVGGPGPAALDVSAGGAEPDLGSVLSAILRDGSEAEPLQMAWGLKDGVAACPPEAVPYLSAVPPASAAHHQPSTRISPFQMASWGAGHAPHADPQLRDDRQHQQQSRALHTAVPAPLNPPVELLAPPMHQQTQNHQQQHFSFLPQQHNLQQYHQQPLTQQTPAGHPTMGHMGNTSGAAPQPSSAQAAFFTSAAAGAVPPWAGPIAAGPVGKRRRGPSRSGSVQPTSFDRVASGGAEETLYDASGSEEEDDGDGSGGGGSSGASMAAGTAAALALLPPGSWTPPQGGLPGPVDVYVFGKKQQIVVAGKFHPDRYLAGQDCIWYQNQFVSRSKFEKEGGSTTAKWHCSIKIAGQRVSLGMWLQDHGLPVLKGAQRRTKQARINTAYQLNATAASAHTRHQALAQPLDAPGRPGAAPLMSGFGPTAAAGTAAAVSTAADGGPFGGGTPLGWCMGVGGPLGGSAVAHGPHAPGTGVGALPLGVQGRAASSALGMQQQHLSMLRTGSDGHWAVARAGGGGSSGAAEGPTGQSLRSMSFNAPPASLSQQWAVGGRRAPQGQGQQQQPVGRVIDPSAVTAIDDVGGGPAFVVPSRVVSTELAAPPPDGGRGAAQGQGQQHEGEDVGEISFGPGGFGGRGSGN